MSEKNTTTDDNTPTINLVERTLSGLHPLMSRQAREGPIYNPLRVAVAASLSGPEAVEALLSDPALLGCHVSDKEHRKELVDIVRWLDEQHPPDPLLRELSAKYVVVQFYGGKATVFFLHNGRWEFISPRELVNAHANQPRVMGWNKRGNCPVMRNVASVWLEHPANQYYETAEFLPGQIAPPTVLNLWIEPPLKPARQFAVNPNSADWYARWNNFPEDLLWRVYHFCEHTLVNMCDRDWEYFEFLVGFMIDAVINIHQTGEIAVVLRGPSGSGKGFWAKHFMQLFGRHHITLVNPKQLTGKFNAHLQDKSIVFADEAFFSRDDQHAASLKVLITDDEFFCEPKGVNGFMAPKRWRLIMASNNEHVIHAMKDDRRFFVLRVDAGEHNNDGEYFDKLDQEWERGEKAELFRMLTSPEARQWLACNWDSHARPVTKELTRQKEESLEGEDRVVFDLLSQGESGCESVERDGRLFLPTRELARAARLADKRTTKLGVLLGKLGGENDNVYMRARCTRNRRRGYWLPCLPEARENFGRYLGWEPEWPAGVDHWTATELEGGVEFPG